MELSSTWRARAGSVAPIRTVGGKRQMAATTPRNGMPATKGISSNTSDSENADAELDAAYTRRGWRPAGTRRGKIRLPRHIPPIKVARRMPSDTAVEPMTNSRSWNQTIS